MVKLSERLQRLADEAQPGDRIADIGTDHGLLPIFLYENHIASQLILCDINAGPLEKARENIEEYGAEGITDLRRGNGLEPLVEGEADTIIIAGMGGLLIADILARSLEKAKSCRRLVLQPRNAPEKLRRWLFDNGFQIVKESLVRERKYICEIITAIPERAGPQTPVCHEAEERESAGDEDLLTWEVSPLLFERRDSLLVPFLEKKIRTEEAIIEKIRRGSGEENHQRIQLAEKRLSGLTRLLEKARELR